MKGNLLFSLARSILFQLHAETAHDITLDTLSVAARLRLVPALVPSVAAAPVEVMGLQFPNPVGLAAGLDKNGTCINGLASLGFGFIEIGTITPKGQSGNPKKRLFRLKADSAIINRMGFNNGGLEQAIVRLKSNKNVLIGGNIGKNKLTPNEKAFEDYNVCFNGLFDVVDYFVVNVSSPNTPNLRELQDKKPLTELLLGLMELNQSKFSPKPILLKIAPDLSNEQLLDIIEIVRDTKIAGVIATNTTIDRTGLKSESKTEVGGLSGKPLNKRSTEVIRFLSENSQKAFPIIGVGGIHSAQDALDKIEAGADLVQLYTGFVYEGPALIKRINKSLIKKAK